MFYQIFFSPQVKRCVIVTYKNVIYELPNGLPNDFRIKLFRSALCHMKISASLRHPVNDSPWKHSFCF